VQVSGQPVDPARPDRGLAQAVRAYGRGSRLTALRSARALIDSPISASSAAACAAVPTMSRPLGWGGRWPLGLGGTPGG